MEIFKRVINAKIKIYAGAERGQGSCTSPNSG